MKKKKKNQWLSQWGESVESFVSHPGGSGSIPVEAVEFRRYQGENDHVAWWVWKIKYSIITTAIKKKVPSFSFSNSSILITSLLPPSPHFFSLFRLLFSLIWDYNFASKTCIYFFLIYSTELAWRNNSNFTLTNA